MAASAATGTARGQVAEPDLAPRLNGQCPAQQPEPALGAQAGRGRRGEAGSQAERPDLQGRAAQVAIDLRGGSGHAGQFAQQVERDAARSNGAT
ncbi:hypothetical protein GCM10020219_002500 [Nonomuraea dietziae]